MPHSTDNYKFSSTFTIAPTAKLFTKPILIVSININLDLALKSNICQNPAHIDTINPIKQLDSTFNSNKKKINIIIIYSNIEKYLISHLLKRATFQLSVKLLRLVLLVDQLLNVEGFLKIAWQKKCGWHIFRLVEET